MEKEYTQLRIWVETLKTLRRVYAETGESMISIVDRLASQEWERLSSEDAQIQTVHEREE